jgi:hypothetical protein
MKEGKEGVMNTKDKEKAVKCAPACRLWLPTPFNYTPHRENESGGLDSSRISYSSIHS